jgi:hypothetical protein
MHLCTSGDNIPQAFIQLLIGSMLKVPLLQKGQNDRIKNIISVFYGIQCSLNNFELSATIMTDCHRQNPPEILEELHDALVHEWNNIPQAFIYASEIRSCRCCMLANEEHGCDSGSESLEKHESRDILHCHVERRDPSFAVAERADRWDQDCETSLGSCTSLLEASHLATHPF